MTTPRPLELVQHDDLLKVKSTNAIYCAAQSTQVANDILRRHNSFDAMKAALEATLNTIKALDEDYDLRDSYKQGKQAITLAEGKE